MILRLWLYPQKTPCFISADQPYCCCSLLCDIVHSNEKQMQIFQKITSLFSAWHQFVCMNDFPEIHDIHSSSWSHWSAKQKMTRCWLLQSYLSLSNNTFLFWCMNGKDKMRTNAYWSKVVIDKMLWVTSGFSFCK